MKLVETNWHPTDRQLRQFACIAFFVLPLLGWFWDAGLAVLAALTLLGFLLAIAGVFVPAAVKPVFIGTTVLAMPLGLLVGELSMLLIYFGLFFPLGLALRLLKHDPLQRTIDKSATTYWQPKRQPDGAAGYYRRF